MKVFWRSVCFIWWVLLNWKWWNDLAIWNRREKKRSRYFDLLLHLFWSVGQIIKKCCLEIASVTSVFTYSHFYHSLIFHKFHTWKDKGRNEERRFFLAECALLEHMLSKVMYLIFIQKNEATAISQYSTVLL